MLVTLLTLAVGATVVPTLAVRLETPAVHHAAALSDVAAIVLLAVYVISIPFWLRGGPDMSPDSRPAPGPPTRHPPASPKWLSTAQRLAHYGLSGWP